MLTKSRKVIPSLSVRALHQVGQYVMGALTSNRLDVLGFLKALEICFFDAIDNFLQVSMLPLMSYIASQLTAHKS